MPTDPRFVDCIFDPDDLVEVRMLRCEPRPDARRSRIMQRFVKAKDITSLDAELDRRNREGENIYVGANPRRRNGGKNEDVALARCLFADLDGIEPEEGLLLIAEAGLPRPTCIVASGHGLHAWWRLREAMEDLDAWRKRQKDLIAVLGSDPVIHDPPRVMRLPRFVNHKDPAAECWMIETDPALRYHSWQIIPSSTQKQTTDPRQIADYWSDRALSRACSGNRNDTGLWLACQLRDAGLAQQQAEEVLQDYASKQRTDYTEAEALATVRSAYSRAARGLCRSASVSSLRARAGTESNRRTGAESCGESDRLPVVYLPTGDVTITEAASNLGTALAQAGDHFLRGGVLVRVERDSDDPPRLVPIRPMRLASDFERVARLHKCTRSQDGELRRKRAICSEQNARLILNAESFLECFSHIRVVTNCPVLIEREGKLVQVCGFDEASGIMAGGTEAPDLDLNEALNLLNLILADFKFASDSDWSRAAASIITPALVFGGLLGGRAPLDLSEADASQTGKGYRNKLTAAVYGSRVHTVTQHKGGVGGLKESFDAAVLSGEPFVAIDNVRGRLDSQAIESYLTEDWYVARVPYQSPARIDARRTVVMLTSNRAELTIDMANRASAVRLLKQREGYRFAQFTEGDILDHIRGNQARFLGAVFTIAREWQKAGKPQADGQGHDFRSWGGAMTWIVTNILDGPSLLAGHRDAQRRMSTPYLNWMRDVGIAVADAGQSDQWLRAHDLLDLLSDTEIEIPGRDLHRANREDRDFRQKALMSLGRRMAACFQHENRLIVDGFRIERVESTDLEGRTTRRYRFSRHDPA